MSLYEGAARRCAVTEAAVATPGGGCFVNPVPGASHPDHRCLPTRFASDHSLIGALTKIYCFGKFKNP